MDSSPATTATVTLHAGLALPDGHVLPGAAETAVFVRNLPPVSGLLTVTE